MRICKKAAVGLVLATILGGGFWVSAFAETHTGGAKIASKTQEEAIKERLAEARALIEQGLEEDAEKRIAKDTHSLPQSAEWYQETAADLLRIALSAHECGDTGTAQRAARLTLVQLGRAEELSQTNPEALAGIFELRGFVRERLLGTTADAALEYKKALKHDAGATSAKQKLRVLEKSPTDATQLFESSASAVEAPIVQE